MAISSGRSRSRRDQEGQGLIEYALLLMLIAVIVIALVQFIGKQTSNNLCGVSNALNGQSSGALAGWGDNSYGEMGSGPSGTPVTSETRITTQCNWVMTAAGQAATLALAADGTVWSWGIDDHGQLGRPSTATCSGVNCSPTPSQVLAGACSACTTGVLSQVVYIGSGANHSIAVRNDGSVWTWGANASGQLGNSNTGTDAFTPVQVRAGTGVACQSVVATCLSGIVQASGGQAHSIALDSSGKVWTWGNGASGELGNGCTPGVNCGVVNTAASITMPGGLKATSITPEGGLHTTVLLADGTVASFGDNAFGQIGQNVALCSPSPCGVGTPTLVAPGTCGACAGSLNSITAIADSDNAGFALRSDGTLYSWGKSLEVGANNPGDQIAPVVVQIPGSAKTAFVCGRGGHGSSIGADGTVYGWGQNPYGQTGNGSSGAAVMIPATVPSAAASRQNIYMTCGVYFTLLISRIPSPQ